MCNARETYAEKTLDRFWSKVELGTGCWLWRATPGERYGRFRLGARYFGAHQAAWILERGAIPDGMHVLHNCPDGDNPRCVRPGHLWLGTNQDNVDDRQAKGRHSHGDRHWSRRHPEAVMRGDQHSSRLRPETRPRGEEHGCVVLSVEIVREIRDRASRGENAAALSRAYGVSATQIRRIIRYQSWAHLDAREGLRS